MSSVPSPSTSASHLTRGYLICLAATLALAFTGIFIRYLSLTYQVPPLVLAFWRDVFVTLILLLILLVWRPALLRVRWQDFIFLTLYGLLLAAFNALWTYSVVLNGAAVATVLAYCSAAFTAILGWIFLKESLGVAKIIAVLLGLLGCVYVSGANDIQVWQINFYGILTGIIAGLAYAIYSLFGKVAANRRLHPASTIVYIFAIATVFLLIANLVSDASTGIIPGANLFWLGSESWGWVVLFVLALGPTLGGFGLYMLSLTYLPASVANLISMLEPPLTTIMAYFLFHELLTVPQLWGGALIIGSVLLVRLSEGQKSINLQ
jgi:drug/metabolite transporter (DMT)-like permease